MSRNPELHDRYKAGIEDLLMKGYAEKVDDNNVDSSPGMTWYILHHCVINPNKPENLRIVFDCAAECNETSLNKKIIKDQI